MILETGKSFCIYCRRALEFKFNRINQVCNECSTVLQDYHAFTYYNIPLNEKDILFLTKLEEMTMTPVPRLTIIDKNGYGFKVAGKDIVGLSICSKELSLLPESLCGLVSLKELLICDNKITRLPQNLDKLKNLDRFSLRNNRIRELPATIVNLTSLQALWLNNNPLTLKAKKLAHKLEELGCLVFW